MSSSRTPPRRPPSPLARAIRQLRRDRELSQEALAYAAGLHPKHLSEIERGNKDPRASTVARLADALGVTLGELYAHADGSPPAAQPPGGAARAARPRRRAG